MGIAEMRSARRTEALRRYRSALEGFQATGERENVVGLYYMLGEALRLHGDIEEAWRHRYQALRLGRRCPGIFFHNAQLDAADALAAQGLGELGLVFQD